MSEPAPSLLIVGGGHASLPLLTRARAWVAAGVRVRLLNDHPALYYSGMVPETIGGVYRPDDARIDLVGWCARTGVTWTPGRATALDVDRRTVTTADGRTFGADVLVFDIGSRNPPPPDDATPIRTKPLHHIERMYDLVDELERGTLPAEPGPPYRLLIVGGGAAGVEIALNLSGRLYVSGAADRLALTLIESSERLLPEFAAGMGRYAGRLLRDRGVEIHTGREVATLADGLVRLTDGTVLPCEAALWAAGSTGADLFREAGLPCDERGYVRVDRTLRVIGQDRIFAAGDCAVVDGYADLARIGVHAVKQGPLLHRNVDRAVRSLLSGRASKRPNRFRPYPIAPLLLSTGDDEALLHLGSFWLHGRPLLRLKHWLDLRWIDRYRLPPSEPHTLPERLHTRTAFSRFSEKIET